MITTIINKYLAARRLAFEISDFTYISSLISTKARRLGKKRIFKPTEYETDKFTETCVQFRERLLDFSSKNLPYDNQQFNEQLFMIQELDLSRLSNCEKLGNCSYKLCRMISQHLEFVVFMEPIDFARPIKFTFFEWILIIFTAIYIMDHI